MFIGRDTRKRKNHTQGQEVFLPLGLAQEHDLQLYQRTKEEGEKKNCYNFC